MKWIGQHIWDFISRFRSDVYLEDLTTTTDTSVLVVDANNKVCKNTTTLGGDITQVRITADDAATIDATSGAFSAIIAGGGGVSTAISSTTLTISVADSSDSVKGLVEVATTGEATTGTDTGRAVTPAGVKAHVESRKVHELTAPTSALAMNSQKITGLDTPTSSGDAATKGYVDATAGRRTTFEFKGWGTSSQDGEGEAIYEMPELMTDNKAPFEHDTTTGTDGLTAQTTNTIIRSGGIVMPYAGSCKIWKGWVTSQGTAATDVGIFKSTPVDDSAVNLTPVLVHNVQITANGNTKMRRFSETSFSVTFAAGDILYSAIKGAVTAQSWYFLSTLEVEWS